MQAHIKRELSRGSMTCSPGKIWILITLRYWEIDLKLTNEVFRYKHSVLWIVIYQVNIVFSIL